MKTIPSPLRSTLNSTHCTVRVRLNTTPAIGQERILSYVVKESGRLGRADLAVDLDNVDGSLTGLAALQAGQVFSSSEGAVVGGVGLEPVAVYVVRHLWIITRNETVAIADHPKAIHIEAVNSWHRLMQSAPVNLSWTSETLGAILDDIAASAGVALTRDASDAWSALMSATLPAGLPRDILLGDLIGEGQGATGSTNARAAGRFEPDGSWTLKFLAPEDAAAITLTCQRSNAQTQALPYTRILITGQDNYRCAQLADIESATGIARLVHINAYKVRSAFIDARTIQEVIEQRERCQLVEVEIAPELGLQLWDTVALDDAGSIDNGSLYRVIVITTTYGAAPARGSRGAGASRFTQHLTLRRQTTTAGYTLIDPDAPPPEQIIADTIVDNFDTYGGAAVLGTPGAALCWLQLMQADAGASESYTGGAHLDADYVIEGSHDYHIPAGGSVTHAYSPAIDLDAEGRFSSDDFLCCLFYAASAENDETGYGMAVSLCGPITAECLAVDRYAAGWNNFAKKKSETEGPDTSWNAIQSIILHPAEVYDTHGDVWADDVRIVKADPDDPSTYNDTGDAWNFSPPPSIDEGPAWHIYPSTPTLYFLGQAWSDPGTRYAAIRAGQYVCSNHFAAGVTARQEGQLGLLAFVQDEDNCYEVRLDTSADSIALIKWADGEAAVLATASFAASIDATYTLGVVRAGARLVVHACGQGASVFADTNVVAMAFDSTYMSGRIGLVSYGINSRFFHVRAGSPAHALSAEYAYTTDARGHTHQNDPFGCNGAAPQNAYSIGDPVSGNAGSTYTSMERDLLNNLATLTNHLREALVNCGIVE